ncbi:NnrS family protein [Wohlfahrtiimonas larvae]|uniref:NnrS family protein n=1 Tax=Wohlfahrtiimonas larvae TaxID=1157986 RepID=A0ABP9MFP1_9GAMM|nr:NnrS family protein [Wohlfahrtiimonas larvae]
MFKTIFSYAFRPLYTIAALYVVSIILLWYPLGFQGNAQYPSFFWHGHEMIWGFTGAIIVGFLLTAVSNWTNTPPVRHYKLLILVILWCLARLFIYLPFQQAIYLSTLFDTLFYGLAAVFMLISLIQSKNYPNILVPIILLVFASINILFCLAMTGTIKISLLTVMQLGLLGVSAFIGLIGSRVTPFFTSITLKQTNRFSKPLTMIAFLFPVLMIIVMVFHLPKMIVLILGIIVTTTNCYQLYRWWNIAIIKEPLLWILHIGFFFTTIGTLVLAYAYSVDLSYLSLSTHLIAIGGIGSLTLGMMSRTALGHTGRAMILPSFMQTAFILMIISVVLRIIATMTTHNTTLLIISAILFSISFIIYLYRYLPILLTPNQA